MAPFDLDQTDKLLTTTRAVRKRLDLTRAVPRELVLECIRIATQAPTGGNVSRCRWVVVDDPDLKLELADLYRTSYQPYMAAQREAVQRAGRAGMERIMDSSDYLAQVLHDVPTMVIPCGLDRIPGDAPGGLVQGYYGSLMPAIWSFMLAARSRGLGTAWTTLHLAFEAEAGALLGIPDTVTQIALIPVAYYTGDDFKPGQRRPAEEITYWNGWKQAQP